MAGAIRFTVETMGRKRECLPQKWYILGLKPDKEYQVLFQNGTAKRHKDLTFVRVLVIKLKRIMYEIKSRQGYNHNFQLHLSYNS